LSFFLVCCFIFLVFFEKLDPMIRHLLVNKNKIP
jgi:hypothetical protein